MTSTPDEETPVDDAPKTEEPSRDDESLNAIPASIYCTCRLALSCNKCGKAMKDRAQTQQVVKALCGNRRPDLMNVFGNGPLLVSDIPESAKATPNDDSSSAAALPPEIAIGIDEAGRGSVLGPMVYGLAYWNTDIEATNIPKDFNDSKQLKEADRDRLFDVILNNKDIGFVMRSLLSSEISRNMLRTYPYNLNEMSHDAAMVMIRKILDEGSYQRKLEREFPGIDFTVESKADANYATCSAASVVAKVMRDRMLEQWKFSEVSNEDGAEKSLREFGSGYPSDPKCKEWMEKNSLRDSVFGFSDFLRFSWAPSKQRLEENAVPVVFEADIDDEDEDLQQQKKGMASFLKGGTKRKRFQYFEKRNIRVTKSFA
ncbi:MAG: hypothetical protein SGARI_004005 [Bacillariaceae sp.]